MGKQIEAPEFKFNFKFWEKPSPKIIQEQVDNYDSLKITHSFRGNALILIIFLRLLDILNDVSKGLCAAIIYIPLAFLIYKGILWAVIVTMILITLDTTYNVIHGNILWPLLFWSVLMSCLYRALLVERERKKQKK